jgi:hypothetical protein
VPTHRIDIAQRIRDCDGAEVIRVIDDWREEINGLNQRGIFGEFVDRRIIAGADPNQEVRIGDGREMAQDLRQFGWAELGRSTRAVGKAGQAYLR